MFGFLEPRGPVKAKCSRPYTECEPRIGLGPKGNSALRYVAVTKKIRIRYFGICKVVKGKSPESISVERISLGVLVTSPRVVCTGAARGDTASTAEPAPAVHPPRPLPPLSG